MIILRDIHTLCEAEAALAKHGITADTVYRDIIDQGYRYGVPRDNLGVHIYFNQGRVNTAYFTPALNSLAILDQPRPDAMLGEKQYLRRLGQPLAALTAH